MKRILLLFFFNFIFLAAWAQVNSLPAFNEGRLQRQKTGMIVLGSWAIGNIALGAALAGSREGEEKYFHLMNAGWNVVNLGLATLGYLGAAKADPAALDLYQSIRQQHQFQKILLLNAGLDVGYIAGGFYLMERSKNASKNQDQLKGFGRSIILQGGFLLVFDLVNYFIHARHNADLAPFLEGLTFTGNQIGLHLSF